MAGSLRRPRRVPRMTGGLHAPSASRNPARPSSPRLRGRGGIRCNHSAGMSDDRMSYQNFTFPQVQQDLGLTVDEADLLNGVRDFIISSMSRNTTSTTSARSSASSLISFRTPDTTTTVVATAHDLVSGGTEGFPVSAESPTQQRRSRGRRGQETTRGDFHGCHRGEILHTGPSNSTEAFACHPVQDPTGVGERRTAIASAGPVPLSRAYGGASSPPTPALPHGSAIFLGVLI